MEQKTVTAKQKSKKFSAYATIMGALALAIAIPLNLLASRLNIIWDMTPTNLYELSDTTRNFLNGLDKQVNFYFLMDMDVLSTDDNSMALYHSLEEYASYDNINFIDFEPDSDPDLTKKLQDEGYRLSRGDMVIECEGRSKHIQGINMYQFMTSTNDSGNTVVEEAYFTGENYITGAIDAVTSGRDTMIYFVTGHGEKTIENALLDAMLTDKPVLFIYAEEHNPEEYNHALQKVVLSHGCAILIKNDGQNEYKLESNNTNLQVLSFEDLQMALHNGSDIKTSNWILSKK